MSYMDVFGTYGIPPATSAYTTIVLTANSTAVWPYNYAGAGPILAKLIDVSTTGGAHTLTMPPATEVSVGEDVLFRNVGATPVSILKADNTALATVAAGASIYLYVTDNTTAAGLWALVAYGVGSSSADAAALVGYGLEALGATLNTVTPVTTQSSNFTVDATYQSKLLVYGGGAGTATFPSATTFPNGFYVQIKNNGIGTLTITPTASLIDGAATLTVQPGESLIVSCSGSAYYTVGLGRSTQYQFTNYTLDVTAGGTFTLTSAQAANKLLTFTGTPAAGVTVVVPSVVSIYYLLNSLTSAQSVTVKTAAGTGAAIPQGQRNIAICDAVNVYTAQSITANTSVLLVDGSAATPSLAFSSQTNSGVYKYSVNGVGITANGTSVIEALASGVNFPIALSVGGAAVETATHAAATYATLASPTFTGDPKAPTPTPGDNDTSIATTAFVTTAVGSFAPLASPTFTGDPKAPTPLAGDNDTSIATTAFVATSFAPLASPVFTGDPKAPTPALGDNDTSVATTAFAMTMQSPAFSGVPTVPTAVGGTATTQIASTKFVNDNFAVLNSPIFTGDPRAPTPTLGDNDTSIATTAFVAGTLFAMSLPAQAGNAGKFLTTDGGSPGIASWAPLPKVNPTAYFFGQF